MLTAQWRSFACPPQINFYPPPFCFSGRVCGLHQTPGHAGHLCLSLVLWSTLNNVCPISRAPTWSADQLHSIRACGVVKREARQPERRPSRNPIRPRCSLSPMGSRTRVVLCCHFCVSILTTTTHSKRADSLVMRDLLRERAHKHVQTLVKSLQMND